MDGPQAFEGECGQLDEVIQRGNKVIRATSFIGMKPSLPNEHSSQRELDPTRIEKKLKGKGRGIPPGNSIFFNCVMQRDGLIKLFCML